MKTNRIIKRFKAILKQKREINEIVFAIFNPIHQITDSYKPNTK